MENLRDSTSIALKYPWMLSPLSRFRPQYRLPARPSGGKRSKMLTSCADLGLGSTRPAINYEIYWASD